MNHRTQPGLLRLLLASLTISSLGFYAFVVQAADPLCVRSFKPADLYDAKAPRMNELLGHSSFASPKFPMHTPEGQELFAFVEALVPPDTNSRLDLLTEFFPALAETVNTSGPQVTFAWPFVQELSARHLLGKQDGHGRYLLARFLAKSAASAVDARTALRPISPSVRAEIRELLQAPAMQAFPIWIGDPKVRRLMSILETHLPSTATERFAIFRHVFGDLAHQLECNEEPLIVAKSLVETLSTSGKLTAVEVDGSPLLLKLFAE